MACTVADCLTGRFLNVLTIGQLSKIYAGQKGHIQIRVYQDFETLKVNEMEKCLCVSIKNAMAELEDWLSDPSELGKKPAKIEYTNAFVDEDGINCLIFKYKKNVLGKLMMPKEYWKC